MCRIFTMLIVCLLTVSALQAQALFSADFEGDNANAELGGEWVINSENSSQYWTIPGGTTYASVNDDALGQTGDGSGDLTFTDDIDLTGQSFPVLTYRSFFQNGDYQGADETAEVIVSSDGGTTWTVVGDATPANEWITNRVVLTDYIDQTIRIGFRYGDGNGWNFGFAVDDIELVVPPANDVRVTVDLPQERFLDVTAAEEVSFTGTLTNQGSDTLTSVDLVLSDGTTETTMTMDGLSLTYGESMTFAHTATVVVDQPTAYEATITAMNLNAGTSVDENMEDNAGVSYVNGVSTIPTRQFFAEEATGTWCPWCPRGHVFMEQMKEEYPDQFVGIAVHGPTLNSDPMTVPEYGALNGSLVEGYPSVSINRRGEMDPADMPAQIDANLSSSFIAPANPTIEVELDVETKTLTLNTSAVMRTDIKGDYVRFGFVLVEDEVTGSGSGYAQANNYSGFAPLEGAGIDWQAAPNPVPASQMVYEDVARALMGGAEGYPGSVPAGTLNGETVTFSQTMDFPEDSWNPRHMRAVTTLLDAETGFVHNAQQADFSIKCPTENSATVSVQDNTDGGTPDGAISVTDNGLGIAPFTYAWASGETTADLSGLFPGTYDLLITDHAGCTQALSVEVQGVTNVADLEDVSRFSVTPNPARDLTTLNVQFTEARDVQVGLYDLMGRQLQSFQYGNTAQINQVIELSALTTGTYLVKVQSNEQVRTERIQVVR